MKELLRSIIIVFPLLTLVVIGVLLKERNFISDKTIKEMNRIIFSIFIPVNVFMSIYNSDFKSDFNISYILFIVFSVLLTFIIAYIIFYKVKDNRVKPALIQASIRPNIAIIGIPLAVSIYGDTIAGMAAIGVAFCAPLYNILAVIIFESFKNNKISFKTLLIKLIRNPIIIATLIAMFIKLLNISIPIFAYDTINYLSRATTGISLIILGASFNFVNDCNSKLLIMSLVYKMFIIPLIVISLAVLIGFRNAYLVCVMSLFAQPVAISAYSFASGYDVDLKLTSSIIVYSYVIALISLPMWIYLLRVFSLI